MLLRPFGAGSSVLTHPTAQRTADERVSSQPATQPITPDRPTGRRPFQPGIEIDWGLPAVYVSGHVVLREGSLEFLACYAGKEHESVIRLDGTATHLFLALGLVGLEAGRPPTWNEHTQRHEATRGDLIDLTVEWDRDGERRVAPAFSWLRETEYAREPFSRPWVFAGSKLRADRTLQADVTGSGIAIVDQPDSVLSLVRSRTNLDAALWLEAFAQRIPPVETPVTVVLRRARPRDYQMEVDWRGIAFVDERYAPITDVAELIGLARRQSPGRVQRIEVRTLLHADALRFERALRAAGLDADAFELAEAKESQP